ncbi:NUDIX hydrolase [Sinimarinibacterium thermocellulolyticum]|uniref:NUDIX hydrolase n=1 Tax=Sinimarinibacterium thermocellulolyticum TaxID=3170016 RepID=A0ABV2A912_9GAMM
MHPQTRYCNVCGHPVEFRVPADDHLPRHVCTRCGHVQYRNPKVIVGVIAEWRDGRVLMCRRNIEPRRGLWTFPAGFMEMGETSAAGAAREAREESLAEVDVGPLLMVMNVPYVSQVYMVHCGRLLSERFGPTAESSEVVLMHEHEIPWDHIAFPTIWHSLRQYFEDRRNGRFGTHLLDLTFKPPAPQRPEVPGDDPSA